MEAVFKRLIRRLFPELTAGLHLPRWGRVEALPELPNKDEAFSDPFYPRYAADVQLLDENGNPTENGLLQAIPLPVPGLGEQSGRLEPPAIGTIVEIAFAYGRPDKPFVRCVLPFGFSLPQIKQGESRYQQRDGVHRLVDEHGNFEHKTDENLSDIIAKLAELQCQVRKVSASEQQDYRSPKTWLGSDSENVLKLLSELMATVNALASTCASHKHGKSPAPNEASQFTDQANQAKAQQARLDPITKA